MRRLILAGLLVLTLGAAPPAAAHHRDSPLRPAGQAVHGASPGEWFGRWWEAVLETSSPFEAYPGCVALGRRTVGVVFPPDGGEASCTVRKGSTLVVVPEASLCSDYEDPPFHGDTPAERRACAIGLDAGAILQEVTVDGRRVRLTDAHRAQTPDGRATLPDDNLLGAPAGTRIRFGADGWVAFTKPLARGHHEIVVRATGVFLGAPYELIGLLHVEAVR